MAASTSALPPSVGSLLSSRYSRKLSVRLLLVSWGEDPVVMGRVSFHVTPCSRHSCISCQMASFSAASSLPKLLLSTTSV